MHQDPNIAALLACRVEFESQMAQLLRKAGTSAGKCTRLVAAQLFDLLIESLEDRSVPAFDKKDFDRAYVSRFGDALVPILRGIMGSDVPIGFLARRIDGYWRGVRQVFQNAS
jgi:hypothetical protein